MNILDRSQFEDISEKLFFSFLLEIKFKDDFIERILRLIKK